MIATQTRQLKLAPGPLTVTGLVRMLLEPLVLVGSLVAIASVYHVPFGVPYLILALLVFSLTFPGRAPRTAGPIALLGDIVSGWILIAGMLLMLGWATRTLGSFDERVVVTWFAAAPADSTPRTSLAPLLLPRPHERRGRQAPRGHRRRGRPGTAAGRANPHLSPAGRRSRRFLRRPLAPSGWSGCARPTCWAASSSSPLTRRPIAWISSTSPCRSPPSRVSRACSTISATPPPSIYVVPDIFLFDLIQARMDTVGGLPVLAVCETPFYGVNGVVKRAADLVLASIILALITPLLVAIAIAVKISSPGPALFRQRRYGLDGQEIVVYKFRTMTVTRTARGAPGDEGRRARHPLGAFLRRTSLDELPQFINVLQGRMSIVGPRPHASRTTRCTQAHQELHDPPQGAPGITGWAQVNGLRGETETWRRCARASPTTRLPAQLVARRWTCASSGRRSSWC
jgi:putative colanic acid biosynthesis UDP-glucose lipid carrier transferase